jgi:hypothetical protein
VAYFAGEANWNYFTALFILARSDFTAEETGPWHEDGQAWRRLLVTYPGTIVAHTRQQTYYFDDTRLLRRLDHAVDILGGESGPPAARRIRGQSRRSVPCAGHRRGTFGGIVPAHARQEPAIAHALVRSASEGGQRGE